MQLSIDVARDADAAGDGTQHDVVQPDHVVLALGHGFLHHLCRQGWQ